MGVISCYSTGDMLVRYTKEKEVEEKEVLKNFIKNEINQQLANSTYNITFMEHDREDFTSTYRLDIQFSLSASIWNTNIIQEVLQDYKDVGWRCDVSGNEITMQMHFTSKRNETYPAKRYTLLDV